MKVVREDIYRRRVRALEYMVALGWGVQPSKKMLRELEYTRRYIDIDGNWVQVDPDPDPNGGEDGG